MSLSRRSVLKAAVLGGVAAALGRVVPPLPARTFATGGWLRPGEVFGATLSDPKMQEVTIAIEHYTGRWFPE